MVDPFPGSLEFCQRCPRWLRTALMPDGECCIPLNGICPASMLSDEEMEDQF